MNAYELSAPARLDLLKIWNHIAEENTDAADRVMTNLRAAMEQLAEFPGIGHRRPDVSENYRCWRVYSFIIIYRPESKPMGIVRVLHGHRDFREVFRPE